MSETSGVQKSYQDSFRLEEPNLRKIVEVLQKHASKLGERTYVKFHVHREDDSFYETRDLEQVLSDENCRGKRIKQVLVAIVYENKRQMHEVTGEETDRPAAYISFALTSEKKKDTIRFSAREKSRDWCFLLFDDMRTQIDRVIQKPFVGFLGSIKDKRLLDMLMSLFVLSGVMWFYASRFDHHSTNISLDTVKSMTMEQQIRALLELALIRDAQGRVSFLPAMLASMIGSIIILELQPISRLLGAILRPIFCWGDMMTEYNKTRTRWIAIKWGVVVAFIVSVVAGIFVNRFMH